MQGSRGKENWLYFFLFDMLFISCLSLFEIFSSLKLVAFFTLNNFVQYIPNILDLCALSCLGLDTLYLHDIIARQIPLKFKKQK